MDNILEVRALSVAYKRTGMALDNVTLHVPRGRIVALLGANGAGKSTLIRSVTGLLGMHGGAVTAGTVAFDDRPLGTLPSHRRVRLGMAQVPEGRLIFKHLTVEEHLRVGAAILPKKVAGERIEGAFEMFPKLRERARQHAGWLSGGEQQMLALGRALVTEPRLLLVDELSLGLAPIIVEEIYARLTAIGRRLGTSMLIVEQNAALALEFAATGYVLERGRIVRSGSAAELESSDAIRQAYLGGATSSRIASTPTLGSGATSA